ncbi:Integrator complex subunit [Heracleum sosnowskyi]|uniref:Integrator complex subunit n=1 Tax=Heracleum sosnowskyi TaxID=360622 RepID=A0AAD8N974_9APIA|nr:Integrator complex subunit [Heracleum sosnowskyi]
MEQQLLRNFLELTGSNTPPSKHALTLARSLITNPSTSNSTISTIYQTLTLSLSQNPHSISLHHILALLSDLSLHRPHLRRLIFSSLRSFSLLPNNSPRSVVESLSILVSIAEQDPELVEELSDSVFLSLCFGGCVSVTRWLLLNAKRLLIRPAVLVTVLLGFSKDPYPEIRKVALDGLSSCVGIEDREMMEACYLCGVEMLSDMEDYVRCSAVRVVSEWGQALVASSEGETKKYWSDALFEKLCSIVRDMSVDVRLAAFDAIGKVTMASENILLQTLSKKLLVKSQISSVAGAFVHGMEDEFYEVRRSACSSLTALCSLSSEFACKTLILLVDMLYDDVIAVRLQVLQTVHHLAQHGHQVQEENLNMLFDTLFDKSTSIRSEARRIIQLLKLHSLKMFRFCVNGLVQNLEIYPEDEADIFFVLFDIGRNHGSYAVRVIEETSPDIDDFFEGKLGSNAAKTAFILVLAISASVSREINICRIPPKMFSYAVTLLGRISSGLANALDHHVLFSYLCACSRSTSLSDSEMIKGEEILQHILNDSSGNQDSWEQSTTQVSRAICQPEGVEVVALVNLVLAEIKNIWQLMRVGCINEVLETLRSWKEELGSINITSTQSFAVLVFAVKYIEVLELFGKVWCLTGEIKIDFEKVDYKLNELVHMFLGVDKEVTIYLLELMLMTCTLKLCSVEPWCYESTLRKYSSIYSLVELLLEKGSVEPSEYLVEVGKALHEFQTSSGGLINLFHFKKLLELFSLKQIELPRGLKHVKAELDIVNNTCETPLFFVSGLPVGIPLHITLYNIVAHNRLWVKLTANEDSSQYVYLDLKHFGDCDTIKKFIFVAPFYKTPKANCFKLTVTLGMECLSGDKPILRNCRGPKNELMYLCNKKEVFLSMIVK